MKNDVRKLEFEIDDKSADFSGRLLLKENCKVIQNLSESPVSVWAASTLAKMYAREFEEVCSFMRGMKQILIFEKNVDSAGRNIQKFTHMMSRLKLLEQKWMAKAWKMCRNESFFRPSVEKYHEDTSFLPINFHIHQLELIKFQKSKIYKYYTMGAPNASAGLTRKIVGGNDRNLDEDGDDGDGDCSTECWNEYIILAGIWIIGLDVQSTFDLKVKDELQRVSRLKGRQYAVLADGLRYCKRRWARV
ncbi:hypothetical protein ACOME3_002121 [Neoechinorhynchus agilis]